MSTNPEVRLTLDDAVGEVLGLLTGLDLTYDPMLDRYRAITRQLNRALRATALDNEWLWYHSVYELGGGGKGAQEVTIPSNLRARIINDDAVRLVDDDGKPWVWAYMLPNDALHKYAHRNGLWCSVVRGRIRFSRPLTASEGDLGVQVPVMREPMLLRLPPQGETVRPAIRKQLLDFAYPDLIVARAAYFYAQTDPVMQPRVQTLEQDYKTLMYQLIERDTQHTDMPYYNDFVLPIESELHPQFGMHTHPHA